MILDGLNAEQVAEMIATRRRVYAALQGQEGAAVTAVATELVAKWVIAMPKEMRQHCLDKHLQLLVKLLQIYDQSGDADPLGLLDGEFPDEDNGHANRKH